MRAITTNQFRYLILCSVVFQCVLGLFLWWGCIQSVGALSHRVDIYEGVSEPRAIGEIHRMSGQIDSLMQAFYPPTTEVYDGDGN